MKNSIGIDQQSAENLCLKLNQLLADYQVFYQNLRGFHWNIKGQNFFEWHEKFEEYYNDAAAKIDEIAERILTLGGVPLHSFSSYVKQSKIKEEIHVSDSMAAVRIIQNNFSNLISLEREILAAAGDAEDEGTVSLMSDYISETEKTLWMLSAVSK